VLVNCFAGEPNPRERFCLCCQVLACALLAACLPAYSQGAPVIEVAKFSAAHAGGPFPAGWKPWIWSKRKKLTAYSLVEDEGAVVVKAVSSQAASGLIRPLRIDPKQYPIIEWRWKAANLIPGADNSERSKEDSPLRLYLSFEGDVAQLGLRDRMFFKMIKLASGEELPYASLNYIWENRDPAGTLIPNPNTARIQMIVVESGAQNLNRWRSYERNVVEDYRQAFGTDPPLITGVSLMTDTDNTEENATAYYGDIVFRKSASAPPLSRSPQ
jgi:hypothetical protein